MTKVILKSCILVVFMISLSLTTMAQYASWPIGSQNDITSTFGSRYMLGRTNNYDFHRGIDIKGYSGDNVYAATDGIVQDKGGSGQNQYVLVKYQGNGFTDYYRYTHITPNSSLSVNDLVSKGTTLIGTIHPEVQFGTHLDLKYYWDTPQALDAVHPLQIFENYSNSPINEMSQASKIKSDAAGHYIEMTVISPADAPDFEWIKILNLSGTAQNGLQYDEFELLRGGYELSPEVDFHSRENCGDKDGDDTDDGIIGDLSGRIAIQIVTQNFDGINSQILKFKFYLNDRFFDDPYYDLVELTGDVKIQDCLETETIYNDLVYLQPGPITFDPAPGTVVLKENETKVIKMYSSINGDIYFDVYEDGTYNYAEECDNIRDVEWGYSPYYYPDDKYRRTLTGPGRRCIKAAVYTGGENFTENSCGCWDVEVITGVNDYLNINELTATEVLLEHGDFHYEGVFVDADYDGTTFNDWHWQLKLFHSGGEYVFQTGNNFTFGGLYYCLPDGYNWTLVDGKIQGEVVCYGYDSDGTYQEDTFAIEAEVASDCIITPVISSLTQSPEPICQGSYGYVYCNLSQGNGSLSYSWSASNLPSGAYITPMGNKCKVSYSTSSSAKDIGLNKIAAPVAQIYCTVSNSAGSDNDSMGPSFNTDCGGGGCPTLAFSNDGTKKENENTLLISSLSNPGEDVTDYYLINTDDKIKNGNIDFYIHEPEEEHTWFDEIELWELKADKGEFIAVTDEGEFINFKEEKKPYTYTVNDSLDITAELESNDGLTYSFMPGDLLRVEPTQEGKLSSTVQAPTETYAVVIGIKPPPKEEIVGDIYVSNQQSKSASTASGTYGIGSFYLRENISTVAKRIGELNENDAVEIIFNNETELDYFVLTRNLKTVKAEKLELISSEKGSEDLGSRINQTDETYAGLLPGEEIHFKYKTKQNVDKKKKIKHVLKVVGRYEKSEIEGLSIGKEKGDGITSVEEELPKENQIRSKCTIQLTLVVLIQFTKLDKNGV